MNINPWKFMLFVFPSRFSNVTFTNFKPFNSSYYYSKTKV